MHPRPRHSLPLLAAAVAAALSAAPVQAHTHSMQGMGHGSGHGANHGGMAAGDTGAAYATAMDTMMAEMDAVEPTGDPDADFLLLMIPHHQSAVDMARVLLEQSDDAEVSALAQAVIDTQEAEIAAMKGMLARLGHPVD